MQSARAVLLFTLALCVMLASCASQPKGPPAVADLSGRTCAASLQLAGAVSLVLPSEESNKGASAEATIDGNAPCLAHPDGTRSLYAVFELPESETAYLISVSAIMLENGLFAPSASLLSESGATLRQIPRDAFVFRGAALSAHLRRHPGERYLLLASDPEIVGQAFSQTQASVNSGYAGFGIVYYTGSDITRSFAFTHSGVVKVQVSPIPEVK